MSSPFEQLVQILGPLVDQPVTQRILSEASALRDLAIRAQEATMGAMGVPTASDVDKLERRIRSLSDTVEDLEDELAKSVEALRRELAKKNRAD